MRPDARAQSAIEILDRWRQEPSGLDRILMHWARSNRYAGSGDRAAIADLVYDAVRRLRSAAWVAGNDGQPLETYGRTLIHGTLLLDQKDHDVLFSGERHAPEPLTEAEASARRNLDTAPHAVRYDYPDWMRSHLAGVSDADLDALRQRAPLDLRVNTLKADPQTAVEALDADGILTEAVPGTGNALRVRQGSRKVARSTAYQNGLVEIQDVGSQRLADLAEARPGERIIDLCAGGGGKSLAMAASSGGKAHILAHDISMARLSDLPARAERAGATVELLGSHELSQWRGKADLVFVDAPCSGSGAWRRNPDAKWRFSPKRLCELTKTQRALLEQAADLCAPAGRIVYGTCSMLDAENTHQVNDFLTKADHWIEAEQMMFRPSDGGDGFFGSVLSR